MQVLSGTASPARWLLPLALSAALAACPSMPLAPDAHRQWDAFAEEFVESHLAAHPEVAVWAGRHEFDGRLPDFSRAGLAREVARLHAARARATSFDAAALDARRRFEHEHLLAVIDDGLFWIETAEEPFRSPAFYGFALEPDVYILREYAPPAERMRAFTRYARAAATALPQIRANLRTPMPRTFVQRGHILFGGLASTFETDVPAAFAAVDDAPSRAEFREAVALAVRELRALDAWFTAQEADATDDFALGAQRFAEMLRATERIEVPMAALRQLAERDLARNTASLRRACGRFAPQATLAACVGRMKANKGTAPQLDLARAQLPLLKALIERKQLVTIPGPQEALVGETPPYARWNNAQITSPGPFEKNLPSIYQIAPPDPAWSVAEREAYQMGQAELLFVSAHEVWPGHFLQFLHAKQAPSKVGQLFFSYAFSEGWAHYSEELMWEAGLGDGDAETHIGQLINALLRNVRLVSAIGLHCGTMTLADSERMFREQAFTDPATARQQAARGTLDPGYGNYTLGKLMIRKLRDDWTAARGGRAAWRAFHDEFLGFGAPPIPLVRKAMLGADAGPPL